MSELETDFLNHGFEKVEDQNGRFVFTAYKRDYFKRLAKAKKLQEIHKKHPIWFSEDEKNFDAGNSDGKATVILVTKCARCNTQLSGICPKCGTFIPIPTAKPHISWKHELN